MTIRDSQGKIEAAWMRNKWKTNYIFNLGMVFDVFRAGYDFGAKPEISKDLTILDSAWFTITKIQLAYLPLTWSLMFLALAIISFQYKTWNFKE